MKFDSERVAIAMQLLFAGIVLVSVIFYTRDMAGIETKKTNTPVVKASSSVVQQPQASDSIRFKLVPPKDSFAISLLKSFGKSFLMVLGAALLVGAIKRFFKNKKINFGTVFIGILAALFSAIVIAIAIMVVTSGYE